MPLELEIDIATFDRDLATLNQTLVDLEKAVSEIPVPAWEQIDGLIARAMEQRFDDIAPIPLSEKWIEYKRDAKKSGAPQPVWADGGTAPGLVSEIAGKFTTTLYNAVVNSGGMGQASKGFLKELSSEPNLINAMASWAVDVSVFYAAYPRLFNVWLHDKSGIGLMYLTEAQLAELGNSLLTVFAGRIDAALVKK